MKTSQTTPGISRRDFVKNSATLAAFAAAGLAPLRAAEKPETRRMIGIQVGAVSFVDEGVEQGARHPPGTRRGRHDLPDDVHLWPRPGRTPDPGPSVPGPRGRRNPTQKIFHGGNYATPHPEFYRNTVLKQTRAPDHGDLDIVAAVLPAAKKRGHEAVLLGGGRVSFGRAGSQ